MREARLDVHKREHACASQQTMHSERHGAARSGAMNGNIEKNNRVQRARTARCDQPANKAFSA
jgi:hypothetical protein